MAQAERARVAGFELALDRCYQPETHMWVLPSGPGQVRIGMGPLGLETSGTLAQLSFVPAGSALIAGLPFGQLEAAKFVGPLISPVSGAVLAVNDAVAENPGLAERDPYGAGWMVEASLSDATGAIPGLLSDPAEIIAWFAAKVADYRLKGVIAQ
ncbi:MAG: glycine cleavage system protein H [Acidimicrobiales bacterium]|jgi:glycine cleavage system H protein